MLYFLTSGIPKKKEAKYELKSSTFPEKCGTTSPLTRMDGIFRIFLLFKNHL